MSRADELLFDPTSLSPDARFRAVAPCSRPPSAASATARRRSPRSPRDLSAESLANALEESPEESVTVHGG